MDYENKYIKYKTKYLELKNHSGGGKKFDLDHINNMIEELKKKNYGKNMLMAHILKQIMDKFKITKKQYMVIAGYCLHKYKDVTDLDIVIQEGAPYNKLRKSGLFDVDTAKISGDERLVLKLANIDKDAEMEFFPKSRKIGFPSNYYSLANLQSKKLLDYDEYGNPYFNEITCVKQYSDVTYNNGIYYMNEYKISKERVEKNISHLRNIMANTLDEKIIKYCKKKIIFLENLLKIDIT